jgi:hypothetical protein
MPIDDQIDSAALPMSQTLQRVDEHSGTNSSKKISALSYRSRAIHQYHADEREARAEDSNLGWRFAE